ncbi:Peroxisomal membrane protein 11A [Dionaea muscipula]
MEAKVSRDSPPAADAEPSPPKPPPSTSTTQTGDFLTHLETYLAKRDGVDKLLKVSRYATKIILSSSVVPETLPLSRRLKSFESSVGISRKAFRLGKFVQDVNALRRSTRSDHHDHFPHLLLSIVAYGGEGLYYFVEQFIWLAKAGLIDPKHSGNLQKISAWAEFVGYFGSIGLKVMELSRLNEEKEGGLDSTVKERALTLRRKILIKELSVVQDLADGLMALADIRDGNGKLSAPLAVSCAGLLSALISTHKNWVSC